ncbi:daptide-type RiPP biosynthesis methyltransferase [Microbacterium sp.]|uniref:daptide-type RiPP biosynthesis methyltransferase n=1 Tax=Microbacterium sp. TaxID=51671 RepID=UPI0026211995|nr:daptide-type RiPP biosynthesis methyltransferase [Microbacterium sp.]MCV0334599.1 class I SAM-dependent methyltransferase [Microbacterium sp.]MCV0376215.1 class I SAM-dependent methyltransferase [Microbacterium sp.]MCV0389774.1 class I SAM-dependent methyltransferase [Microbacterium sp.]MCV0419309.1 class I SAM-dependent methyltransferase [Microbacterium sp.]MCV0421614.1 class I SAM-dependent methyltransferase [Microbacterium sp.]
MSGLITEAVSARLETAGAVPRELDLYSGEGTDFYERLVGTDRAEIREVLALARKTDDPILDIAAGGGRLTVPLVRTGREVTAIDLSDDMLSHLRRALPARSTVECVVADMRDFSLGRRYGLVIIGATSITLLDRAGRSLLYGSVRRHLATGGVFAFTVAGGAAAQSLAVSRTQEIGVPGPQGEETYLFAQQMEDGGAARVVNWVRVADIAAGLEATVLTSRLQVLGHDVLAGELVDAGFAAPAVSPVRTDRGVEILLLTTSWAGSSGTVDDDATG